MDYHAEHELLGAIQPYKDVMIPYSMQKLSDVGMGLEYLYAALIDSVSVEIVDDDGRRIGIVRGESQDGDCKRADLIYPRELITPDNPVIHWRHDKGDIAKGIELLVDCGRICVRPQGRGYVVGVFNCMKFESCPTRVVQKRSGEWDDFFLREVVISAKDYWSDMEDDAIEYSTSTPALPLPSMIRTPVTPFRDRAYCDFHSKDSRQVFERARNIIFQRGPVGPYRWTLAGESSTMWKQLVDEHDSDRVLAVVRCYALEYGAPFGCRRDILPEFISVFESKCPFTVYPDFTVVRC
jgi:hypothetical protein